MPKGTVFSKNEVADSIVLLLEKYPNGLTTNMIQDIVGSRKKTIVTAMDIAIEAGRVRKVEYGKVIIYKKIDCKITIRKKDIRLALDYYYGKRCEEKHPNCRICKVHEWLDYADDTSKPHVELEEG